MRYFKTAFVLILGLAFIYSCKDERAITKKEVPLEAYALSFKVHEVMSGSTFQEGGFFNKQVLQNWSPVIKQKYVFAPHRIIQLLYNKNPEIMNKLAKPPFQISDLKIEKIK